MNIDPRFSTDAHSSLSRPEPVSFTPPAWLPAREIAALGLMTALVSAACVLWIDRPVAYFFIAYTDTAWVNFFRAVTIAGNSAFWYTPAALGFALSLWLARKSALPEIGWEWRRRARSSLFVIVSMALSGTIVNLLKISFGRYRPRFLFNDGTYDFEPFQLILKNAGFPSGHSQSIVAAMVALGFVWPKARYVFWSFAVVVASSRFITTVHFAADVVAGAFVAVAVAWPLKRYFERNGIPLAWSKPCL